MAVIIITRPNDYLNRVRKINIILDGKKIGTVANNQTQEFNVGPGTHALKASIDWCGSNTLNFTIAEDTALKFNLDSFAGNGKPGGFSLLYKIIFESSGYLTLRQTN